MPSPRLHPIHAARRAYDLKTDEPEWVSNLLDDVAPGIDRREGMFAAVIDASDPARTKLGTFIARGDQRIEGLATMLTMGATQRIRACLSAPACGSVSQLAGIDGNWSRIQKRAYKGAFVDFALLSAVDPVGVGICFGASSTEVLRISPQRRRTWSRVAAHIAAGFRLRQRLLGADPMASAEALLTPAGRLEHLEKSAESRKSRQSLVSAARILERTRTGKGVLNGEEALRAWTALVEGRWSIIHHVDTDGRRFLVARRNEPAASDHGTLTQLESRVVAYAATGQAYKFISYELGLPTSTIADNLRSALRKLRVRSRVELCRLYGPMQSAAKEGT